MRLVGFSFWVKLPLIAHPVGNVFTQKKCWCFRIKRMLHGVLLTLMFLIFWFLAKSNHSGCTGTLAYASKHFPSHFMTCTMMYANGPIVISSNPKNPKIPRTKMLICFYNMLILLGFDAQPQRSKA